MGGKWETMMPKTLKPPYLRKAGQRGRTSIWIVDGTYVRTHKVVQETLVNAHWKGVLDLLHSWSLVLHWPLFCLIIFSEQLDYQPLLFLLQLTLCY